MRFAITCAVLSAVLLSVNSAGATVFNVQGTFAQTGFLGSEESPPVDVVSGSFGFLFDDSTVTGAPLSIVPTSASASVGGALFDETNTEVRLFFEFGNLTQIWFGGLAGGQANILAPGEDDLAVGYFAEIGLPFNISYTTLGTAGQFRGVASGRSGDLVFTVVPEPGTGMLLGLGLVGVAARRHNRRA